MTAMAITLDQHLQNANELVKDVDNKIASLQSAREILLRNIQSLSATITGVGAPALESAQSQDRRQGQGRPQAVPAPREQDNAQDNNRINATARAPRGVRLSQVTEALQQGGPMTRQQLIQALPDITPGTMSYVLNNFNRFKQDNMGRWFIKPNARGL